MAGKSLTEAEREELKKAFAVCDKDGNGRYSNVSPPSESCSAKCVAYSIDLQELGSVMQVQGPCPYVYLR